MRCITTSLLAGSISLGASSVPIPCASRRHLSDPPRNSSTHDGPATRAARPALLVRRHALASSPCAVEGARCAFRQPRSHRIVSIADTLRQCERLCSHWQQRLITRIITMATRSSPSWPIDNLWLPQAVPPRPLCTSNDSEFVVLPLMSLINTGSLVAHQR